MRTSLSNLPAYFAAVYERSLRSEIYSYVRQEADARSAASAGAADDFFRTTMAALFIQRCFRNFQLRRWIDRAVAARKASAALATTALDFPMSVHSVQFDTHRTIPTAPAWRATPFFSSPSV